MHHEEDEDEEFPPAKMEHVTPRQTDGTGRSKFNRSLSLSDSNFEFRALELQREQSNEPGSFLKIQAKKRRVANLLLSFKQIKEEASKKEDSGQDLQGIFHNQAKPEEAV